MVVVWIGTTRGRRDLSTSGSFISNCIETERETHVFSTDVQSSQLSQQDFDVTNPRSSLRIAHGSGASLLGWIFYSPQPSVDERVCLA
jgi:hypothetical protein